RSAGVIVSIRWSSSMEAEKSQAFVETFKRRYDRLPSSYALQGYDAALMLADGLRTANKSPLFPEALERALAAQQVDGIEGPIRLASNGFPITNWSAWEVFNMASGAPYLVAREQTLAEYRDPHASHCLAR